MSILKFLKEEAKGWGKYEKIIFPSFLLFVLISSITAKDNPIALVSAICGLSYTILAGKGKISCYYIGLVGTLCYSYLSYKSMLYGNLCLYALYYFPMQVVGIFKWKKHLKSTDNTIKKTRLPKKKKILYLCIGLVLTTILAFVLKKMGDNSPIIDSITTIFSIFGLLLTVKRCIEQWYIWIVVNGLSMIMWIQAYCIGAKVFATILMWLGYFVLSIYFLKTWKNELGVNDEK